MHENTETTPAETPLPKYDERLASAALVERLRVELAHEKDLVEGDRVMCVVPLDQVQTYSQSGWALVKLVSVQTPVVERIDHPAPNGRNGCIYDAGIERWLPSYHPNRVDHRPVGHTDPNILSCFTVRHVETTHALMARPVGSAFEALVADLDKHGRTIERLEDANRAVYNEKRALEEKLEKLSAECENHRKNETWRVSELETRQQRIRALEQGLATERRAKDALVAAIGKLKATEILKDLEPVKP